MGLRLEKCQPAGHIVGGNRRRGPVAPENSVRIKAFYRLLPYFSAFARRRRMEGLMEIPEIKRGICVLDLGGSPSIWEHVSVPLDVTILNLRAGFPPSNRTPFARDRASTRFITSRATRATSINSPIVPST